MKVAIYPGSFNPFHAGHNDVLNKAFGVFDKVIIAIGDNPSKFQPDKDKVLKSIKAWCQHGIEKKFIEVVTFDGLFADFVNKKNENNLNIHAVIRGLRNGTDLEYEKTQQYWNEDLKIGIPTVYFIADRNLVHISSSAIQAVNQFRKG